MQRFVWISLAGAAGTGTRYLISLWTAERLGSAFPYGTLIVNVAGCFFIALIMQSAAAFSSPLVRSALTIGFLGGFTTYSSFNYETTRLLQEGASGMAAMNAAVMLAGCFAAGWLGIVVSRQLLGP